MGSERSETGFRYVGQGLFEEEDGVAYLLGCVCVHCGEVVFPFMRDCPRCVTADTMRPKRLLGAGVITDFVVAHRGASGFRVPYIQSYVLLDDGPLVYSMIDAPPSEDAIAVGERVTMKIQAIREDEGVQVVGWIFRPVAGEAA